jgi:hypothetical protein
MSRTGSPHHRILERFLDRAMDLVTHIFDSGVSAHDECLVEVWFFALPVGGP